MSQPPQPPYSGQPYGQPSSGQPYQGQPPYPGPQYPGQPNPDVPTSVPPQPGYPPTSGYPAPDYGQPQYGQPQQGQPQQGQPQQGQPQYGQPQYGQPQYGQPQYEQPQYEQPQYEQPQYGQPQYGQPQYGQPDYAQQGLGQPGFPPPTPPKKKSKALPIVLISIAVVLVLCVGGSIAIFMAAKNKVDDLNTAVNSTATGTPTATESPSGATSSAKPASTVTIVEPKTLGGRPKLTDPQLAGVAKELQGSFAAVPGATTSIGALYGRAAKRNIVIVTAAKAPIDNPADILSQLFDGASQGGLKIDNISPASTGALGGSAKCGSSTNSGINMAICSWADDGSIGMLIWQFKTVAKAKAEFPKLRAEIEKKA